MLLQALALFLFATPFWNLRPPGQWTDGEVKSMLTDSPWVQLAEPNPLVTVMLATALPLEEAMVEAQRRGIPHGAGGKTDIDYVEFLKEHRESHFVLAIPYSDLSKMAEPGDDKRLEDETMMRIGRARYRMAGHFPPTPSDPVLRLIFPRKVTGSDKNVDFDLYLPGIPLPSRTVQFRVKDLMYRGKLEM